MLTPTRPSRSQSRTGRPSGTRALTAAPRTDDGICSVSEDDIAEATERLATHAGLYVKPARTMTLAAIRQLTADGEVGADEAVVAIATGTGFKELDATVIDTTPTTSLLIGSKLNSPPW